MASIINYASGRRAVQFYDPQGERRTVSIGKTTQEHARDVKGRIERILGAKIAGCSIDRETAVWLKDIGDQLRGKLVDVGLIDPPEPSQQIGPVIERLGPFVERYIKGREGVDVKPGTVTTWKRTRKHLVAHFGESRDITTITAGCAKDFRLYCIRAGLAENTLRRTIGIAKQFFEDAVDREIIAKNPFRHRDLPTSTTGNRDRMAFISHQDAQKLLDAASNAEWRAIIALARYGGLRTPSETFSLKWDSIDWARGRMLVTSPKTEHHEGKGSRIVPLFPELREHLDALFEQAPPGAVYVVAKRPGMNLRTTMEKIVHRAGLVPWPRLFQNLRSTRQTELEDRFPSHVVCAWLGNSRPVADKHYLQVTDAHFESAATGAAASAGTGVNERKSEQPDPMVLPANHTYSTVDTPVYTRLLGDEGLESV